MKKLEVKAGDKIGKNYIIQDIIKSYKNWFRPVFWVYNKQKKCCKPYTESEMLFILKGLHK
jgi:hypothetical protein